MQEYGFTPECDRRCLASSSDLENLQLHPFHVHRNGFSPVWRRKCVFKCDALEYNLSHPGYEHTNILSSDLRSSEIFRRSDTVAVILSASLNASFCSRYELKFSSELLVLPTKISSILMGLVHSFKSNTDDKSHKSIPMFRKSMHDSEQSGDGSTGEKMGCNKSFVSSESNVSNGVSKSILVESQGSKYEIEELSDNSLSDHGILS